MFKWADSPKALYCPVKLTLFNVESPPEEPVSPVRYSYHKIRHSVLSERVGNPVEVCNATLRVSGECEPGGRILSVL